MSRPWPALALGALLFRRLRLRARKRRMRAKYGDTPISRALAEGMYWLGQSGEMLMDALGEPEAVEEQVLDSGHRQLWLYQRDRHGQPGIVFALERGEVVGWVQDPSWG